MLKHFVEYLHPGIKVSDTSVVEIAERDINQINLSENSFGFR